MQKKYFPDTFTPFPTAVFILCLSLAWGVLLPTAARAAVSFDITRTEWSSYLNDAALKEADNRLNGTYRKIMGNLGPEEKQRLLVSQRAWIIARNKGAFSLHAKGSPEYIRLLAEASAKREAELRTKYANLFTSPVQKPLPSSVVQKTPSQPAPVSAKESCKVEPTPARPARKTEQEAPSQPVQKPVVTPRPETAPENTAPPVSAKIKAPAAKQEKQITQPPASAPEPTKPALTQKRESREELIITLQPEKLADSAKTTVRRIDMTPSRFGKSYNRMAHSFKTAPFPLVPTNVTGSGKSRTEHYAVSDEITIQFKYTNGVFESPEIITFQGRHFMTGTERQRDEVAYSLITMLKTLNQDTVQGDKSKDAEILGFIRSINNAFTDDASRIWKNNGLVYVITYMKKNDLFAMTINVDSGRR